MSYLSYKNLQVSEEDIELIDLRGRDTVEVSKRNSEKDLRSLLKIASKAETKTSSRVAGILSAMRSETSLFN